MALSIYDIITSQYIKDTFALGVDLTLDDGSPFPEAVFEDSIKQAVAMIEADLGIYIDPYMIEDERHDSDVQDRKNSWQIDLNHYPLRSVDKVGIRVGTQPIAELPPSWITIRDNLTGQFNIIPIGSAGAVFVTSGVPLFADSVFYPNQKASSYFSVSYTAGHTFLEGSFTIPAGEVNAEISFAEKFKSGRPSISLSDARVKMYMSGQSGFKVVLNGGVALGEDLVVTYNAHDVDPLIMRAIGLVSALLPLNVAGDLIAGAGVASQSLGLDGLTQSVTTTASATSAGYGARIIQYTKELQQTIERLRSKYRRMNFWAR